MVQHKKKKNSNDTPNANEEETECLNGESVLQLEEEYDDDGKM